MTKEKETSKASPKKRNWVKIILLSIVGIIVVGVVGLFAAAAAAKYFLLTPVESKKICEHLLTLSRQEIKAKTGKDVSEAMIMQAAGFKTIDDCVKTEEATRDRNIGGNMAVTKKSKCEISAKTITEFEGCGAKTNPFRR